MNFRTLMRKPTAYLPVVMSFGALAVVLGHIVLFGTAHEADEGSTAHIFQLLIAVQVPVVAYFAITWLPKAPKYAVQVLSLQAGAAIAALAPVYFLNL